MATNTYTTAGVNNLFKNAANWSIAVPSTGDGHDVVIAASQTCIFDDTDATTYTLGAGRTLALNDEAVFQITALAPIFRFATDCIVTFVNEIVVTIISFNIFRDVTLDGTWNGGGGAVLTVDGSLNIAATANFSNFESIITLDGAAGSHTVLNNITVAANCPGLVVNADGSTYTALAAMTLKAFTLTAGTYADGGFDHFVYGDILLTGGTLTGTGTWEQMTSGNVQSGNYVRRFKHIKLGSAGVVSNLSAETHAEKITFGPGSGGVAVTAAAGVGFRVWGYASDCWVQPATAGSVTISLAYFYISANITIGRLNALLFTGNPAVLFLGYTNATIRTVTLTDRWSLGTKNITITGNVATRHGKLACAGFGIDCGNIILGHATVDASGLLDFGTGSNKVASITALAGSLSAAIDFGSCYLSLSGILNGANTAPSTNVACHIQGGTVQNVNNASAEYVHCHGTSDGTGNTNVDFDAHTPPGSMAMMGCGI